jgi:hypothetical protein
MRILTEQIFEEESKKMNYISYRPQGANIFLALQVPGSTKHDVGFLALEREDEDNWVASFWSIPLKSLRMNIEKEGHSPRKKKIHEIKDHRPEKILTKYAKLYRFYSGE